MSGVMLLIPVAQAQSTADLQTQIAALLAQIQQLQAQLTAQQGGAAATTFTRNLTVGSTGSDVKALQQFLNSHGAQIAASGAGSPGSESTYFGSLTKAALGKWQAANGVSPAAGYFGPVTRAKVNALTGGVVLPGGGVVVPAPASGMTVSLAPENPAAGSLISSASTAAARVPVFAVRLTAGTASGITVSDLKFHKTGVVSDSSISGAYLVESGKVVAQYNSISGGVVTFSGLGLSVAAGQTRTLTLAIDPASGLSAGNTIGFALSAATDVSATDATNAAVTVTGVFPLNGNTFTVTSVTNPSIAALTVASSSIGTSVTAGTQNNLVGAWNFTGSNSKIWLKTINFRVIGSANKTDIKNVKLLVNGTQVGSTLASVASDGSAYFDASVNPGVLNTGANNVQVYADVMGSPSFNFQFEVLNSFDIYAVDSQYNVPVAAASNTGTQVTINQGQITVNAASDTPTGNVAKGQSNVTLAKFTVYAAGEPVKIKWLTFTLSLTGTLGNNYDSEIKNISIVDDAGGQLGSTISSLTTSVTCTDSTFNAATSSAAVNCFGNSTSPINYIIPANTTRVLSLKGDIQSGAGFGTITAALVQGTSSNLQGTISSQGSNSSAAGGSALTLASSALTVAKNTAVGTQTFSKGATNRKIGSYALSASSAEGVTINNVSVLTSASSTNFTNLKVMVGSSQIGNTQGVLSASATYSFAGNFTVPAGQTSYVDVYADVLSGAGAATYTAVTTLSGCSGSGAVSYTAISCTSTGGQNVTIAGQATVRMSANTSLSPAAGQIVMGSTGNSLAAFQLTETTNIEDIKITDLYVFDSVSATGSVKSALSNLKLYKSTDLSTVLANSGAATAIASGTAYYYAFHFFTPVVVPQANSVSLVLKGDVSSYTSQGATDNTTHVFKVATTTDTAFDTTQEVAVALGNTSNATSVVTLSSASGNTLTVLRSKVTATAAGLGVTTSRGKTATDDLGTITFAADSAGSVAINTVTITFSGSAPTSTAFLDGVTLLDANGISVMNTSGVTNTTSSACTGGSSTCTKLWNLGSTTSGWNINGGSSYTFKVRASTYNTAGAVASVAQTLALTINASTDVLYTDGLDSSATSTISLPASVVPITINSITFAAGL